ncbi:MULTISPECIES: cytidylyltransferase domain-containing protein [unclassified Endozoicomonas]|uniref:acylneuraminate cytidylyltransferase family protein n=1 Tax=unclassified Endozoicomonas TaxID=2644528 RepID=UPI003BB537AB
MEKTAVIVARSGSIRVKNKALQLLGEYSLLARKILQLSKCQNIDRIIVGSDSEEILLHADYYGAETVKRENYYCDEKKCSANEMIENMCSLIETDLIIWAHCTNPLITPSTYDLAIDTFIKSKKHGYDSLLSVISLQEHLWSTEKKPLNYNPYQEKHTLAKDIEPYYMQDGGIFIQQRDDMLRNKYFFGKTPYLFSLPENEFFDINTERDLHIARSLCKFYNRENI